MTDTATLEDRLRIGGNNPPEPIVDPVAPIRVRVNALVANANKWANERPTIETPEQATAAKDFVDQLLAESRAAEEERKKINAPWALLTKANNDTFKVIEAYLLACVNVLRPKLTAWGTKLRLEQEAAAREAEKVAIANQREADRLKREAEEAAAKGKGDVVGLAVAAEQAEQHAAASFKAADKAAAAKPVIKSSYGGRGTSNRTHWHFQVTDAALVPAEYLCPDEIKIGAAVRRKLDGSQGVPLRELAGVRIWPEESAV